MPEATYSYLRIQNLLELVFLACYGSQSHQRTETSACKNGTDASVPSTGARETDGETLRKKPPLGFIKCCSSMTHEADSCKEIKSREKYIAGPLTAGGYMSGYKCLLSGKGGETPMF